MLRIFGDHQPAIPQESISIIFRLFDYLDPANNPDQFNQLKLVNKVWRDLVNEYHDRLAISAAILSECQRFIGITHLNLQIVKRIPGGMTNRTLFFQAQNRPYIGRLPGKKTDGFISRHHESYNINIANQIGIAAPLVFDTSAGVQVTQYLPEPEPMSRESLLKRENITLCMAPLKRLHSSRRKFSADTDVFQRNYTMLDILEKLKPGTGVALKRFSDAMSHIQQLLSFLHIVKVPCHNDTTPSNFIKSQGEIKIIDWEYANNNDPMWDLACLSIEAGFSEKQDMDMLEDYFGIYPIEKYHHLILYKPVVEFWTMLWADVQIANKNYTDENGLAALEEMSATRKQSCLDWLEHADFKTACQCMSTHAEYRLCQVL